MGLGQQHPPGTVWVYNNAAIQTLDRVIRAATGEETAAFAEQRLFDPLGMTHTRMTADGSGESTNVVLRAPVDLPRPGAVRAALRPGRGLGGRPGAARRLGRPGRGRALAGAERRLRAAVVAQPARGPCAPRWTRTTRTLPPSVTEVRQLAPGAPADLYAALGFGGQVVLVDPTTETVVVRLGNPTRDGRSSYKFARCRARGDVGPDQALTLRSAR